MRTHFRHTLIVCLLVVISGAAANLRGQVVTGMSDIAIQCIGCPVQTYSLTELDYTAAYWYIARADGYLSRGGTIVNSRVAAYGSPWVDFFLSTPLVYNTTFQIQTNHWVRAFYEVYVPQYGGYRFLDQFGFSMMSSGNWDQSTQVSPPYQTSYIISQDIYLGATYTGFHSPSPVINGINVTGNPVRGGSGYVEIYGSYFDGLTTVTIDGGGVSTSVTYQSDHQVNISYSIASNASTGNRNLRITTLFGPSNAATFTVYDPTPNISSVSPDSWTAGNTTSFTVSGSGFGSNPSLSIAGTGVTGYGVNSHSDSSISAWVTLASNAPSNTGTVTVTSNGYGGSGFIPAPQGGSTNQASKTAAIIALVINMKLERLQTVISSDGLYSEDTTIRITAVRNDTGATVTGWTGNVNIGEHGTSIYTQNGGTLPSSVSISH